MFIVRIQEDMKCVRHWIIRALLGRKSSSGNSLSKMLDEELQTTRPLHPPPVLSAIMCADESFKYICF